MGGLRQWASVMTAVTPERRVTAYYFVQAMSVGAVNGFAGIWLSSKGLSAGQIGIINAAPVALVLLISLTVGRLADQADDWRRTIVIGAVLSGVIPIGLLVANGFWVIALVWTLAVTAQMVVLPVTDAAAIRMSQWRGGDFGALYAWKTIGYLGVIFAAGFLLERFGVAAFLPLFIALGLLRSVASFGLPRFRAPADGRAPRQGTGRLLQVMRPWFLLPLAAWSLVHSTHFVLNGFLGLLWAEQGIPADTIGLLIGLSGITETAMFFAFKRYVGRFSARRLILVSCLVAVVRWVGLAVAPGVPVLVVLQMLHAFTYALGFLACTHFIAKSTSEDIAAEAQSFFVVIELVAAIAAVTAFGWLADVWGARAFYLPAVLAVLGAGLVGISGRRIAV